jgi:hypothetical protein
MWEKESPESIASGTYVGLWRRLPSPGASSARAYWMQTYSLFAQLRIPAERPQFEPVAGLSELSDEALLWLARQEGFAGRSVFKGNRVQRERVLSFQRPCGPDSARVFLSGGLLVEEGIDNDYVEEWQTIADCATDDLVALELVKDCESNGRRAARAGFLLVVGDYFIYAMERRPPFASDEPLAALVERASDREEKAALLDCEISFGRRRGSRIPWEIQFSTLPFREGRAVFDREPLPVLRPDGTCIQIFPSGTRRWEVREWSPGVSWGGK